MDAVVSFFKSEEILVFIPGEVEYERSVATANLLYRFARPGCVVQPKRNSHIRIVIEQAKSRNISVTIKNGGHSFAGASTAEQGISLDLIKMNKVDLDIGSGTATIEGGALWGHVYKKLVNDHHDGYMINGGRCPPVGVSGFILGSGLGPFTRSFGMGSDALQEATIVVADGRVVTVRSSDPPQSDNGRLFWALCGAGGGNFGVVVELKLKIQRLQGSDVVAGMFTWSPRSEAESSFMATMNSFYMADWPNEMTIDSSWLCDLQQNSTEFAVRFITYYNGTKRVFDSVIDQHVQQKDLAKQLKRRSLAEKSTRFLHETLVEQWSEEIVKAFPSERTYRIYTSCVFPKKPADINKITSVIREEIRAYRSLFAGEQGRLQITWIHSGGKASEKERSDTAFRWRDGVYHMYIMVEWDQKFLEMDMRGFLQRFKQKLQRFSIMGYASFINFPDQALPPGDHEMVYYGNNRRELRQVKKLWDKDYFFDWAQGVRPPYLAWDSSPPPIADKGHSERETAVDEETLTDVMATQQWESFKPGPKNDFVRGIRGLTDLGF